MAILATPRRLSRAGVLGLNRRNTELCLPLNPRGRYPLVDDKAITKALCQEHQIPVPETYALVDRFGMVRDLERLVAGHPDFAVKPARGAGGRGVVVIARHDGQTFVKTTGETLSLAELRYHVSTAMSGLHSLGGLPDRVIIERRVRPHPAFELFSVGGTPDTRIIMHLGAPLMAMMRLPTRASDGRANLHQGAIGVGIDLASGRTTHAVCQNRSVDHHPDTGAPLRGVSLPHWDRQLELATRLARVLAMGYVGIDLALDPTLGPVVLEANARPGLAIQMANRQGLLTVLRQASATGNHALTEG